MKTLAKLLTISFIVNCLCVSTLFGITSRVERPPLYIATDAVIQTASGPITLRAGTAVVVEAAQNYDSKHLSAGQTVAVRVKYNVVVNKQTLIAAGSLGVANVSKVIKPKGFGKGGALELTMQSIQAVDGQQILVSGIPMMLEGDNKKGLAWGLGIGLGIFTYGLGLLLGLAIKGKTAELKAGTTLNAAIASDTEISVQD